MMILEFIIERMISSLTLDVNRIVANLLFISNGFQPNNTTAECILGVIIETNQTDLFHLLLTTFKSLLISHVETIHEVCQINNREVALQFVGITNKCLCVPQ